MKNEKTFVLRLPDELLKRLKACSEKELRSVNSVIRIAVEKYLEDKNDK